MNSPFIPKVGAVMSADIAIPDQERMVQFYASVLTTGEDPRWKEDLMNNLGFPIIGLGVRVPEYESLPLQWTPHIQVADVGESARQALALGGTEVMHGKDDNGVSQWAVFLDPNGAAFGLIPVPGADQVPSLEGLEGTEKAGRIAWLDLTVPNAEATRDFYTRVVGWSVEEVAMEDGDDKYADYSLLAEDGSAAAGVCHARGMNAGLPPVWLHYLPVGDVEESLRRVSAGGGEVIVERRGEDQRCLYAVIQDPVGVKFAILQE